MSNITHTHPHLDGIIFLCNPKTLKPCNLQSTPTSPVSTLTLDVQIIIQNTSFEKNYSRKLQNLSQFSIKQNRQ